MIGDLIDGVCEFFGIGKHGLNVTDADLPLAAEQDQRTARGGHHDILQIADEVHHGPHDRAPHAGADRAVAVFFAERAEGLLGGLLLAIGNDRAVGGHHFLYCAVHGTQQTLTLDEMLAHELCEIGGNKNRKRNGHKCHKCHNGA